MFNAWKIANTICYAHTKANRDYGYTRSIERLSLRLHLTATIPTADLKKPGLEAFVDQIAFLIYNGQKQPSIRTMDEVENRDVHACPIDEDWAVNVTHRTYRRNIQKKHP